jgi:diguanylate cyclase (GGDEF)-like protein
LRILRPDGSTQWIEATGLAATDPVNGRTGDTILFVREIPQRCGVKLRLASLPCDGDPPSDPAFRRVLDDALLALTDSVTSLANRSAFGDALDLEWSRAQRSSTQMSLLLVGLDGFKTGGEALGRRVEDASLRAVAATVCAAGRRVDDFAARYDGDDLALLLPNTPASGAAKVAHRLQANIAALDLPHPGTAIGSGRITASLGAVTGASRNGDANMTPTVLMTAARSALDHARRSGCSGLVAAELVPPDDMGVAGRGTAERP